MHGAALLAMPGFWVQMDPQPLPYFDMFSEKHLQIWHQPPLFCPLPQFTLCPISREGKILKVSAPQEILANIGLAAKYDNNVRLSAFNMNEKKCIHLAVYHIF